MPEDRGTLREIAWQEIFPWLSLVRTFRLAIQARPLVVASAAVLATTLGWWLLAYLFSGTDEEPLKRWLTAYESCPWTAASDDAAVGANVELDPRDGLDRSHDVWHMGPPRFGRAPGNPFLGAWRQLSAPVRQLFDRELTYTGLAFLLLCGLWAVAVWALFGGAITRMAAMQLAREEKIGLRTALRYAWSKWRSYFAAPLFPLLGVLLCTVPMALVGLVMRLDVGVLLMGILWPLMLAGGLLMAILLVGLVFGWPLMWPTISTEGTDSFDALSRSYSYVYHRPLHYLFYAAAVTLLGGLGWLLVWYFTEAVANLPTWAASWGSGNARMSDILNPPDLDGVGEVGAIFVNLWEGCVRLAALGFVYSYFWTASTAIYFLLRRDDDGTETDEIHVEEPGQAFGLPPLETDAAGVPVVAKSELGTSDQVPAGQAATQPDKPAEEASP